MMTYEALEASFEHMNAPLDTHSRIMEQVNCILESKIEQRRAVRPYALLRQLADVEIATLREVLFEL